MRAALASLWLPIAAGGVALVTVLSVLNHQHASLAEARRQVEAAQLALKNQIVSNEETAADLSGQVAALVAKSQALAAAYAEAKSAAPAATVVCAATLQTKPVRVHQVPAVTTPKTTVDPDTGPAVSSQPAGPDYLTEGPPAPVCVLHDGDYVGVRVTELALRTAQSNYLLVGTATVWRESPDRAQLTESPFTASLSNVNSLAPQPSARWGAALLGVCGVAGCSAGPALLLPPVSVFGLRLEAQLGGVAGKAGVLGVGQLGARW